MIGDSELLDIIPAKIAGLKTFHVKNGAFDGLVKKVIEVLE